MTPVDQIVFATLALVVAIAPPLLLRSNRQRWALAETGYWSAVLFVYGSVVVLGIRIDPGLLFSLLFVSRTILFLWLVMSVDETALRWNAKRAAVATGIVYLLLVPHVLQWPLDGDEPFFLLITESILRDGDLDLANQYQTLEESAVGRLDLEPQFGDPVGDGGEQYSRHAPLLPVLLVPGYLSGGAYGAAATIALLGALLILSILRLLEEEGFGRVSRTFVWPAVALAPPVLFYATRLWTEVPAALCFSEALRAARSRQWWRMTLFLALLSLLKLRFGLIAAGLILVLAVRERPGLKKILAAMIVLVIPIGVVWLSTGELIGVHQPFELLPGAPLASLEGLAGIILDAQAGLLFQAPLWLLGLLAFFRRETRSALLTTAGLAVIPYVVLLIPRAEWHGGWSPPLRYLVVLAPLFALGLASVARHLPRVVVAAAGVWSAGLVIHGIAYPWRLFRIADGESVIGEMLSRHYGADFSRLLPSLIRPNAAAVVWALLLVVLVVLLVRGRVKIRAATAAVVLSVAIAAAVTLATTPGRIVHLEDAHVTRHGGELFPHKWTVARFRFEGGWTLREGEAVSFRIRPGPVTIRYESSEGATIELGGRELELPPSTGWATVRAEIPRSRERAMLKLLEGTATFDRIAHE
jgi:hypothetical protein